MPYSLNYPLNRVQTRGKGIFAFTNGKIGQG